MARLFLAAALAVALLGPALPAAGGDVVLGGILPGNALVRKPVLSMREARYRHIVPQTTDYSCGAAALATVLKYAYGMDIGEREVLAGMLAAANPEVVRTRGFSMLDLKNYAATLGFDARGFEIKPEALARVKVPTIVLLDIKGYRHFVVLRKVAGDIAHLADPALGNREMKLAEFVAGWNGILLSVKAEGYDLNNGLAAVEPALSARHRVDLQALAGPVPAVEFGPGTADLLRF